ncbi:MAG: PA2778 family cysteine peptidase [Desulfobacteraceae bacterium]|nr:MAG: PA2778 family cysteine peptidase [Desulfobacteraceae bacterium]
MSRATAVILFLVANLILTDCGGVRHCTWPQPADYFPAEYEIDSIPFHPQKAYQCGPAALAMVLGWSGIMVDPDALAPKVFTPSRKGSLQSAMIGVARRQSRVAYPISSPNEMLTEVAAGHPVIVLQNLGLSWYPVWHYAVVIGYDLNQGIVILHSGVTSRKQLTLRVFENTWARSDHWGLLVLPPSRLPATAKEGRYISAVLGLEKARQRRAAVEGYKAALVRWPESLYALIGLGNSYYALGDLESAETAFREATRRSPNNGSAFNNLAQVLWEQGKKQEALEAARKAVSIGGPLATIYQKTLEEIQAEKP